MSKVNNSYKNVKINTSKLRKDVQNITNKNDLINNFSGKTKVAMNYWWYTIQIYPNFITLNFFV